MIAFEFKELVEVTTSKGDGYIWYMLDYGPHSDTLYTIIIKESGECWQMCHKDFRIKQNITMGICGKYEQSGMQHSKEMPVHSISKC
jgi:hypothetical protein